MGEFIAVVLAGLMLMAVGWGLNNRARRWRWGGSDKVLKDRWPWLFTVLLIVGGVA